jgi:hypothetical protein
MRTFLPLVLAMATTMITAAHSRAVSVQVSPGGNPTVSLSINSPGVEDSVSVSPSSGYAFSQSPYLANNPAGLWWDAGGNTFKVAFVDDEVTSADMTVAGKLKRTGGSGGGGGTPQEWDFTQPGVATLSGYVGAVFNMPDEIWVLADPYPDDVDCVVEFYSPNGTVTDMGEATYAWEGDNLGTFSAESFANAKDSFWYTVASAAAGKQGKIKGEFTGLKVDGSGNFHAKAKSIQQKAFEVQLSSFAISVQSPVVIATVPPMEAEARGTFNCSFVFQPAIPASIPVLGRFPQYGTADNLVTTSQGNYRWSKADSTRRWDGHQGVTLPPSSRQGGQYYADTGLFVLQGGDWPTVRWGAVPAIPCTRYWQTVVFETYGELQIGDRPWRTFAKAWWSTTWDFAWGTPTGIIVGSAWGSNGSESREAVGNSDPKSDLNAGAYVRILQ